MMDRGPTDHILSAAEIRALFDRPSHLPATSAASWYGIRSRGLERLAGAYYAAAGLTSVGPWTIRDLLTRAQTAEITDREPRD